MLCMCVMCVIVGNKITSSSLDSFLKSLEMQSEGGLMRLCLEVCCVYLFIILNHSKQTICNLNLFSSLIYNAYISFKYWLENRDDYLIISDLSFRETASPQIVVFTC